MKFCSIIALVLIAASAATAQPGNRPAPATQYYTGSKEGMFEPVAANEINTYVDASLFAEDSVRNADGTFTVTLKTHPGGIVVRREQYRGKMPVGKWMQHYNISNPALETVYGIEPDGTLASCPTSYIYELGGTSLSFGSGTFVPPVLQSGTELQDFISDHLQYPPAARARAIQGTVRIKGTLTETGELTDLAISKSVDRDLDAEVFRVVKLLRFKGPALVDSRPARLCVSLPINFSLD